MWPWRKRSDRDFADEIDDHVRREAKRLVEEEGLNLADARARALKSFGNLVQAQERFHERGRLSWLEDLRRDLVYAARTFRRNPGFAAIAVLTLALGIGATTAIYSIVDAILLRPLPFANSDRLVRVVENEVGSLSGNIFQRSLPYQQFLDWRARTTTLTDVIAFRDAPTVVRTDEGAKRLWGARISADSFVLLGTEAMIGRALGPADERDPNVVVLGFEAWTRIFRSDPDVVGHQLPISGSPLPPLTVVGVLPPRFEFPTRPMDFYRPFDPSSPGGQVTLIGRLRDGVSLSAAMDEANVIGTALRPARPANAPPLPVPRFEVQGLKDEIVKELRPALRVLLATVGVVLMVVCANMANLLLARGTARRREMAVRAAIGAGRARLVRQMLAECLLLAMAGGIVGALIGAAGVAAVKHLATIEVPGIFRLLFGTTILPRGHEVVVDLKVFGVAFGIAAATCLMFGLLPALQLSRTNHMLAMSSRTGTPRSETRLRSFLVVCQMTMATVLLVGAGLLIHSFVKLTTVEKGYDASNVISMQLLFPGDYPMARKGETIDAILNRLRQHSSVQSAGFSRAGVLIGEEISYGTFVPPGRSLSEMQAASEKPRLRSITEGFLPAMGIRFLGGRDLTDADLRSPSPGIVINRRAAAVLFPGRNPVGEVLNWEFNKFQVEVRVVGVVEELRNESLDQQPFPEVFVDYRQLRDIVQRVQAPPAQQDGSVFGLLSFAVRTRGEPDAMIPEVTRIVRSVDANAGIDSIVPLERLVTSSVTRQRFYAVILGAFAAIAAVLACIGVYGVLAYAVTLRTQEIGIRMALGAERGAVLRLVLRQGLILTLTGIGIGILGARLSTQLLQGMLFGLTPFDPLTFAVVALLFGAVALGASYLPARRATAVNPVVALRAE